MARQAHHGLPADRAAAVHQRDAALVRVTRVRRATIIGAGALSAGLAGVVSAIAPGHTLGAKLKAASPATTPTVTPRYSTVSRAHMPPLAKPNQLGLRAPSSVPQAAPEPSSPPPSSSPQPAPSQPAPSQPAPSQPAPSQAAPAPAQAPAVSGGS